MTSVLELFGEYMTEILCEFDAAPFGVLALKSDHQIPEVKTSSVKIQLVKNCQSERDRVAQFITEVYQQTFQADIKVEYPYLICLEDEEEGIQAAAGFRPAADTTLFLEQYLSTPVQEQLLRDRSEIVEIGNLAGTGQGAATFLFAVMAAYFDQQNFSVAVATGSPFLERRFRQLGLQPHKLAPALPQNLKSSDENWGNYYRNRPYVMAGSISHGCQRLKRLFGMEFVEFPQVTSSLTPKVKAKYHVV